METILEVLVYIVKDLLLASFGWAALTIRHRSVSKAKRVMEEKYQNNYSLAGIDYLLSLFIISVFCLIPYGIYIVFTE